MYGYRELMRDLPHFESLGARVESIGRSVCGRDIICFKVGHGGKPVLSTAAIHARENASAYVVRAQLRRALAGGEGFARYFIPLVNPDGAEILRRGTEENNAEKKLWKANADGVDLNVNFDARWGTGKRNVFVPAGENYVGKSPECAPETRALARFTRRVGAAFTLSYHTAGREMYWYFFQSGAELERDYALACFAEEHLRFKYARIDSDLGSAGGYKDFCIEKLGIPALTIELGSGAHPLSRNDIKEDIELNRELVEALSEKINDRRRFHETRA